MTKIAFIAEVAKAARLKNLSKKDVSELVEIVFSTMSKAIRKDRRFIFPDFGTFTLRQNKARKGRNPKTGETIQIKARKTVRFRPAPALKKSL